MKAKFLLILFVIFTFSATSLIVIQIFQTKRSAAISDNMFNINVGNAMEAVISQLNESSSSGSYSINYHTLNELISDELLTNGIDFHPYVGILNASMDEFLYCSEPGREGILQASPFKFSFNPSGQNGSDQVYVVLAFSSTALFLFKTSRIYVYMSLFLIAIIFISFLLSIKIILNQRKLDNMKTDFINNMTHEIKTPIATIGLACEMLTDSSLQSDPGSQKNFINIISVENNRMRLLIETILQNAKMSNKNFSINRKDINLNRIVDDVVKGFSITIGNRGGEIVTDFKNESAVISADEIHISNLIYNLIDNAIKYSADRPYVRISTDADDGTVTLHVEDHGIGISKENQKRVFEKFYRVSTGDVHNVKGFGIGLSYVSQVVALHGGKITLQSELGKGSSFFISFPRG